MRTYGLSRAAAQTISLLWNRTTGCRKQYFLHTRVLFGTFERFQNEFLKKIKKQGQSEFCPLIN